MNSLTVEAADLRKKVNFVRNALGNSKTDLSIILMRLEVKGNKASLFAANKEMFARATLKVKHEGEEAKSFAVLGSKMEQLTARTEAEKINLTWDSENLEAQAGFLTVNFELYDEATIRTTENAVVGEIASVGHGVPKDAIEEALTCARSCTTSNAIRPDVTHAELRGGRMLSSDGRKIMIFAHDSFPEDMNLKIPAGILGAVTIAVKNADTAAVEIAEGSSYYLIKANKGEYALGVRKTERTFPAVEQQIATGNTPTDEVAIDEKVLESMLRGVALGLPSDEVKVTLEIGGSGKEAFLEISAMNNVGRKSHEKSSVGRKKTTPLSFPISYKHMLDTLSVFKGDSVVDLMVMDELKMLMVKDKTEAREVLTIIPFRTDKQVETEKKEAEQLAEARKKMTPEERAEAEAAETMAEEAIGDLEDEAA